MRNKIKKLIVLITSLALTGGCISSSKLVNALKDDPATAHVRVTTVYGTIDVIRTNPNTNTLPHQITADGVIMVDKKESN